jgi:predicted acylesterase/phospholipase RssA
MGLPVAFKPYVINEKRNGWPAIGTYVDGGVWNNSPMREFEGEVTLGTIAKYSWTFPDASAIYRTLLLRLDLGSDAAVTNFLSLLYNTLIFNGESQIISRYKDQVIELDTEGLNVLEFSPPPGVRERVTSRGFKTVDDYLSNKSL